MNNTKRTIGAAGALIAAIGAAVLPWARLTTVFGNIDVSGMDGDGKIALALAVLAGLAALTGKEGVMVVLGLLGGLLMGCEWSNVSGGVDGASSDVAQAGIGSGIYAGLIGFVVVFVAGIMKSDEPVAQKGVTE